ncbi:unnamed protein product [Zymoseptoria tritici ST99CH_3D7]|uniref:Carrier domain-containing protein n=1 Tax=Zymoseptoria tritici (strain ST99CH_3D7) TaxID=1276538 RepID=A0A1X7S6V8_ZYMT9|nr:unnamed protein product [Zymoseptoria tritici ST99CH_3D7]
MAESQQSNTLVEILDGLARDRPDATWWKVPKDVNLTQGWRDITYGELAQAVDGMAKWVVASIGMGTSSADIAAYVGVNDIRYAVVQLGLIKAGYMALLPSPRNSAEGQAALFSSTGCDCLLHSEGAEPHVATIRAAVPNVRAFQIPAFDDLIQQGSLTTPYQGPYKNKESDRVMVLHTSGSSGVPKPIYHTNGSIATFIRLGADPGPEARLETTVLLFEPGELMFTFAPFFHMMGTMVVWLSILAPRPICTPPHEKLPTPEIIIKAIQQTKPRIVLTPPSTLEDIVETPGGLETLKEVKYVYYGGGPLADETGVKVNQVSRVVSGMGSTEVGAIRSYVVEDPADWQYFEWAPGGGVCMVPEGDDLYELVIRPDDLSIQAAWHTMPGIEEYRTRDLFVKHPTKENLWLCKGRKDDVLVLSNGEKFGPANMEKKLEGHTTIRGAIVVGHARFQVGLLLEPDWERVGNDADPADLVDQFWPVIQQANAGNPGHGQVWKSKIGIAKRDKPFVRTPKGTVIRKQTVALYANEIEALYSNEASDDAVGRLSADASVSDTRQFLRKVFKAKGMASIEKMSDDEDIFNHGVDSLQTMAVASTLSHAMGISVSPRVIYSHPTIASLAEHFRGSDQVLNGDKPQPSREDMMAALVEKYTRNLRPRYSVVITGSTGSLGQHILQELIEAPHVEHIYALNRSTDAETRQRQSFETRGITPDFSKVSFFSTDFGQDRFGLDQDTYSLLLRTVNVFIHNAWSVDFNKTLPTYEDVHIAGTRRVVDFSIASQHHAHIVFIATIATVMNWSGVYPEATSIPERLPDSYSAAGYGGYGEGKHVASMILAKAAETAQVPVTIIRPGQLAGSAVSTAEWNRHEWFPSLIISSKALGMLPTTLGAQDVLDWMPMDAAATAVREISEASLAGESALTNGAVPNKTRFRVAHIVNPRTTTWQELSPTVQHHLAKETGKNIQMVEMKEWVKALSESPRTPEEIEKKPAIKLLEFFESLAGAEGKRLEMETRESQAMSERMRSMQAVDSGLVEKWLKEWQR